VKSSGNESERAIDQVYHDRWIVPLVVQASRSFEPRLAREAIEIAASLDRWWRDRLVMQAECDREDAFERAQVWMRFLRATYGREVARDRLIARLREIGGST
jgi:hypothetical protein